MLDFCQWRQACLCQVLELERVNSVLLLQKSCLLLVINAFRTIFASIFIDCDKLGACIQIARLLNNVRAAWRMTIACRDSSRHFVPIRGEWAECYVSQLESDPQQRLRLLNDWHVRVASMAFRNLTIVLRSQEAEAPYISGFLLLSGYPIGQILYFKHQFYCTCTGTQPASSIILLSNIICWRVIKVIPEIKSHQRWSIQAMAEFNDYVGCEYH